MLRLSAALAGAGNGSHGGQSCHGKLQIHFCNEQAGSEIPALMGMDDMPDEYGNTVRC